MNEENLYLVYVEYIGKNSLDMNEYEFLFSENPETVWGEDWAEQCPAACHGLRPTSDMIAEKKRLATMIPFGLAQGNTCFSMQDCIDGIVALAWEDMSDYEEYPEPMRIVFRFGEKYREVEDKLSIRHQFFSEWEPVDDEDATED